MGGLDLDNVREGILYLIAFIVSVAVHEFGHALVADRLGDRLPRSQGRLTLSPIAHIDPIGTLLIPAMRILYPGLPLLAWGRPVQTNPTAYTRRFRMKTGHMFVAAAGPCMNLLLALGLSAVAVVLLRAGARGAAAALIEYGIGVNLSLMLFNLLPLPPLDGGTVLAGLLPDHLHPTIIHPLQRYGGFILLGLVLIPGAIGFIMAPAGVVIRQWIRVLLVLGGLGA